MTRLLLILLVVFGSLELLNCKDHDLQFISPVNQVEWDSTTVIHYYHGGGMRYESLDIYVRYDSCIRIDMDHGKDMRQAFAMTKADREKMAGLLSASKFEKIRQQQLNGIIHDKATTSVCVTKKGSERSCASSGASTRIHEKDQENFRTLCDGIIEFSLHKK